MRSPLLALVLFLFPITLMGQDERMEISATTQAKEVVPGEVFIVKVKLDLKEGFYTYPTRQKDPAAESMVNIIRVKGGEKALVEKKGDIKEPEGKDKFDPALNATITKYDHPVEFEVPLVVKKGTPDGNVKFTLTVTGQACDDMSCLPGTKSFDFEVVSKGNGKEAPAANKEAKQPGEDKPVIKKAEVPAEDTTLLSFILTGVGFGFGTLLTPCVFPMIPITVSFFLKQNKSKSQAIMNALVYTLTIVISLAIFAYLFVSFFQKLTQMSITNMLLAGLFFYFAFSLFGAYEITLPGFLTRWTSAGEAKGGYIGTIFMAMTFTIISFSCVAPFMGGFAGATAQERPVLWNILGSLSFATAFASPFFVLALFPSWLKALPKSGSWMNTLKVIMGFLEVAAAIKFIRTAEVLWRKGDPIYMTFDVALALYISICVLSGFYLLGMYKLPHDDHDEGHSRIGVGRLFWSMLFFGLGVYLLPALFRGPDGEKMRPAGVIYAWIDAFLLPSGDTKAIPIYSQTNPQASNKDKWITTLPEALKDAKANKRRIFVDFTGMSCTNCMLNERRYFNLPKVKEQLDQFTRLKLYTDTVPLEYYTTEQIQDTKKAVEDRQTEDAEANKAFQLKRFDTTQLPLYAVIEPAGDDFKVIAKYREAVIPSESDFIDFLRKHSGR